MAKKISEKDLEKLAGKSGTKLTTVSKSKEIKDLGDRIIAEHNKAMSLQAQVISTAAKDTEKELYKAFIEQNKIITAIMKDVAELQVLIKTAPAKSEPVPYEFVIDRDAQGLPTKVHAKPKPGMH